MADTLVRRLAGFAASVPSRMPEEVGGTVRSHLVDTLGVAIAAAMEEPVLAALRVMKERSGAEEATVWVHGTHLPAASAALVNGTMAHALDFDDSHLPSVLHPSASVVPAGLAVAEATGAPGRSLVAAVAAGLEITCRLGMAAYDPDLRDSVFFANGLHATSICGTLGAAATAAILLGLDTDGIAHAMAVGASMGAGLLEANRTGGSIKPLHCGWAAQAGITAAQMAAAGITGPDTVLEGRFGFFRAHTGGRFDQAALVGELGTRWEVSRLFVKPYPTNHFTHAGIDAALELRAQGLDARSITAIELGVPEPVLRTIAEPLEEKVRPRSGHHAKFSGPFTVATALCGGGGLGVTHTDFTDEAAADSERLRLAALVRCVADGEATESFPHQFPAVLRVWLTDGSTREIRIRHTRGGPERPLSPEDLALKFRLNAERVLGTGRTQLLLELASSLDRLETVSALSAATVAQAR